MITPALLLLILCFQLFVCNLVSSNFNIDYPNNCDILSFQWGNVCKCTSDYCDEITPLNKELILKGQAAIYESTSELAGTHRLRRLNNLEFNSYINNSIPIQLSIDYSIELQTITGFGGAFTDSASIVAYEMDNDIRSLILEQYYTSNGLEYNIGRINMGACDFSTHDYTYDDTPNDWNLDNFTLAEDMKTKIPLIQEAISMSNKSILFFGSTWTSPNWLKNSSDLVGTLPLPAGNKYHKTWAKYYSKWIDSYNAVGIT